MLMRSLSLALVLLPSYALLHGCSTNNPPEPKPNQLGAVSPTPTASAQSISIATGEIANPEFLVDPAGTRAPRTQNLPVNCVNEINLRRSDANWLVAFAGTRILIRRPSARTSTRGSSIPPNAIAEFGQNSRSDESRLYALISCGGSGDLREEARVEIPTELGPRHTVMVTGNVQMAQSVSIPLPGEPYPAARESRVSCVANEDEARNSGLNGIFLLPGSKIIIVREWQEEEPGGRIRWLDRESALGRAEDVAEGSDAPTADNRELIIEQGPITAEAHVISCT